MKSPFKADYHAHGTIGAAFEYIKPDVIFVRGGKGWVWGDRYSFTCLIETFSKECEIKGYLGLYNKDVRNMMFEYLKSIGIRKVEWERRGRNERKVVVYI